MHRRGQGLRVRILCQFRVALLEHRIGRFMNSRTGIGRIVNWGAGVDRIVNSGTGTGIGRKVSWGARVRKIVNSGTGVREIGNSGKTFMGLYLGRLKSDSGT